MTSLTTDVTKANELDRREEDILITSKEVDEKENVVTSTICGALEKSIGGNPNNNNSRSNFEANINGKAEQATPVDRAMFKIASANASPSALKQKNDDDIGPLSPVRLNLVNLAYNGKQKNHTTLSKNLARSSQEEKQQKLLGSLYQDMMQPSSNLFNEEDNTEMDERNAEVKNSSDSYTSHHLDDEVDNTMDTIEEMGRRQSSEETTTTNEQAEKTKNSQDTNNILNQSKQLAGFLGGTFRSALNQNRLKAPPKEDIGEVEQKVKVEELEKTGDDSHENIISLEEPINSIERKESIVQRAIGGFALNSFFSSSQHSEHKAEESRTTEDSNQAELSKEEIVKDKSKTKESPSFEGKDTAKDEPQNEPYATKESSSEAEVQEPNHKMLNAMESIRNNCEEGISLIIESLDESKTPLTQMFALEKEGKVKEFDEMTEEDSSINEEEDKEVQLNKNNRNGNDEESQTLKDTNDDDAQLKSQSQKYWQTLLVPSEQITVDKAQNAEGKEYQASTEKEISKSITPTKQEKIPNMIEEVSEEECSPQSIVSIPEDYSPGGRISEGDDSPKRKGSTSHDESSPGSLLHNIISAATTKETPIADKNARGVNNNATDSSPAGSDFYNMLSAATAAQTPILSVATLDRNDYIVGYSPAALDFSSMLRAATDSATPNVNTEAKSVPSNNTAMMYEEKYFSKEESSPMSIYTSGEVLDDTPVKSNRMDFRLAESSRSAPSQQVSAAKSTSSLLSNCDQSEDGSIYTTLSHQLSIQSNTPRSRRVMEWLDSNQTNTVSWPVPSMATKVTSTQTPERQLPAPKPSTKSTGGENRVISHQLKSKSKKLSDWWIPKLHNMGGTTSPTSLPSLLGTTSVNEVSDLESPNIVASALNFKFSDEESTIQSQSIHEASDIHSVPGNETLLLMASPQSLMTVSTPTVGYPTDEEYSVVKGTGKVKTYIPRDYLTPSTASISLPHTMQGNSVSPHSTITRESFQQEHDDLFFKPPTWLKRCVVLGILVAVIGAISVVAVIMTNGKKDEKITSKPNTEEEWMNMNVIDIGLPTTSPTRVRSATKTAIPTIAPPLVAEGEQTDPTSELILLSTNNPTSQDNMLDFRTSYSPTSFPTKAVVDSPPTISPSKPSFKPTSKPVLKPTMKVTTEPTLKPTSKVTHQPTSKPSRETIVDLPPTISPSKLSLRPTSKTELTPTTKVTTENTSKPTSKLTTQPTPKTSREATDIPTVKPISVLTLNPTAKVNFSEEQLQQLTWNRIVNGEDIWRPSEVEIIKTPLWYFATDNSGIRLEVINAAKDDRFLTQLSTAVEDYSKSESVSLLELKTVPHEVLCPPPKIGQVKVCSGDFGNTNWIGSTVLFMRNDFIVAALIRINENPVSSPAGDALFQYALCHQLGHALGLSHNTADIDSLSCMQDFGDNVFVDGNIIRTNDKLEHPNTADLDALVTLYGSASKRSSLRGR